ncbi:hypothetical protein EC968_008998 [Mortierella alpina]|nr:hypothetical protein EC968_008998 [Mortierella alpina]
MARLTLFPLLVMALFQVALALPYGLKTIVNKAADGVLKGEPFELLSVQPGDLHGNPWYIEPFRRAADVTITTLNHRFFVSVTRGQANLTPERTVWSLEWADQEFFRIKLVDNVDSALGWDKSTKNVYVERWDGGDEQLWQIRDPSYYYGRMYRQY